jgi:hypothetical protein
MSSPASQQHDPWDIFITGVMGLVALLIFAMWYFGSK